MDSYGNAYVTGYFYGPATTFGASPLSNSASGNAPFITQLSQNLLVTLTTFAPGSGAAGAVITFTGSGFTGATAVSFNGTSAPSFTVNSDTQITVTVPPGATSGPVHVVTPAGTASSGARFTVAGTVGLPAALGAGSARLTLAPNPARGLVTVQIADWPAGAAVPAVEVFDALGRRLRSEQLPTAGVADVLLTGIRAGVYTVRCGALTQRLLVE